MATRTVTFLQAGKRLGSEKVFLMTDHRTMARAMARTHTIFHQNRYSTILKIPVDVFRANFRYEPQSGIYRTSLTYADVARYTTVLDHGD
jgi:hypothetical protein